MQTIKFKVTKADLAKYQTFQDKVSDYPFYASTSGLSKADMVLLGKLSEYQFANDDTLEVSIKVGA